MGDENSSTMMIVVLGMAAMCCSSAAGLGFAWYNNNLCECCGLCNTESSPATSPATDTATSPATDTATSDSTGDATSTSTSTSTSTGSTNSSSNKLPSDFFASNGGANSNGYSFYLMSAHSKCKKLINTDNYGYGNLQCRNGMAVLPLKISGTRKNILIRRANQTPGSSTSNLAMGTSKMKGKNVSFLYTNYTSGDQAKLAKEIKDLKLKPTWDIQAGPSGTVYLYNTGHKKYVAVDSCGSGTLGSGKLTFIANKEERARWKMARDLSSTC